MQTKLMRSSMREAELEGKRGSTGGIGARRGERGWEQIRMLPEKGMANKGNGMGNKQGQR